MQLSDKLDTVMLVLMPISIGHWSVESETGMYD
jgi:hypothetical protein